jgi:glycine hydroxymethyltransferase
MKESEMKLIAGWIAQALENRANTEKLTQIRHEVAELAERFPLYAYLRQS